MEQGGLSLSTTPIAFEVLESTSRADSDAANKISQLVIHDRKDKYSTSSFSMFLSAGPTCTEFSTLWRTEGKSSEALGSWGIGLARSGKS